MVEYMRFTLKGKANNPPPEFEEGFQACIKYHKENGFDPKHMTLQGEGWYRNGWAEGNITCTGMYMRGELRSKN